MRQFTDKRRPISLNILASSSKKAAATKAKTKSTKKKTTNAADAAAAQNNFASTYVSSPVRETARPPKGGKNKLIDDEAYDVDDSDEAFEPADRLHPNGYGRDGFVVDDDDDDDFVDDENDGFIPVREDNHNRRSRSRPLGPPIRGDVLMNSLDETQREFINDFVANARQLGGKIQFRKSLRDQPFSDTILRAMAFNRVKTEQQMLRIDGIRPEMVENYGEQYLSILKNLEVIYEMNNDDAVERPHDPNHVVVVDLCSDEEGAEQYGEDVDFDDLDAEDGDEDEEEEIQERSSYFARRPAPATKPVATYTQTAAARNFMDRYDSLDSTIPPKRDLPWRDGNAASKNKSSNKRRAPYASQRKFSGSRQSYKTKRSASGVKKGVAKRKKSGEGGSTTISASKSGAGSSRGIALMPT